MRTRAPRRTVDERFEDGRHDVAAPPVERVLAMQRGAGNQAVARMLTAGRMMIARGGRPQFSPSPRDRAKIHVTWEGKSRAPGGGAGGKQLDHTTAYSSFEIMIESQVEGKTLEEARTALTNVLAYAQHMPGFASAAQRGEMTRLYNVAVAQVASATDIAELAGAAWTILCFRQKVPNSNRSTRHGGRGRENRGGLLAIEDALRDGNDPAADEATIAVTLWKMLDLTPTDELAEDTVIDIFKQHLVSMRMSCPRTFARFPTMKETMVGLLREEGDAIDYFWSRLTNTGRHPMRAALIRSLRAWKLPPLEDVEEEAEDEEERERKPGLQLRSGKRVASGGGRERKRSKV